MIRNARVSVITNNYNPTRTVAQKGIKISERRHFCGEMERLPPLFFLYTVFGRTVTTSQFSKHLGKGSRKNVAVLLDFVQITLTPPSPQFGQLVPLF